MQILATPGSLDLAQDIALKSGNELNLIDIINFPSGESRIIINKNLSKHICLVHSLSNNNSIPELIFLLNYLNAMEVHEITLCIPYLAYARQDKIKDNEPNYLMTIANIVESAKVIKIIIADIHNLTINNYLKSNIINIEYSEIFSKIIENIINEIGPQGCVIVAPDEGSWNRAKQLAFMLNIDYILLTKLRSANNIRVDFNKPNDRIKLNNKKAIIVDDIIDSGKTIFAAAKFINKYKASSIDAVITHPVMSIVRKSLYSTGVINKFYITNSIVKQRLPFENYQICDISSLLTKYILS